MHYQGKLYRALNPVYARDPFSGIGAALYGGRFNPKGTPALYLALSPATALLEANQSGSFQPTTLVAYDADLPNILDCGLDAELAPFGRNSARLADPSWRDAMKGNTDAPTQKFAQDALAAGYVGLHVPS